MQESLENISQFLTRQILKDPMHLFAREFANNLALEVEFSRKISVFISEIVQLLDDFMLLYRVEKEEVLKVDTYPFSSILSFLSHLLFSPFSFSFPPFLLFHLSLKGGNLGTK